MQFELNKALTDEILFSMEDQAGEFLFDTLKGVVAGGRGGSDVDEDTDDAKDNTRYIPLPKWSSASGFRLMERFASGFRNPLIREELSAALGVKKGVFRAFKNVLGQYPETEKLWFSFKAKEMKREIFSWYNALREEWGLEKIGVEPEETGDLVLEDFRFRALTEDDFSGAAELHRQCIEEYEKKLAETGTAFSVKVLMKDIFPEAADGPFLHHAKTMAAESGGGEFAGYISGIVMDSVLYVQNLEVREEFRGLGIGEALLTHLLESIDRVEIRNVLFDLPSWAEGFSRVLLRESFKPYMVRYRLDLDSLS